MPYKHADAQKAVDRLSALLAHDVKREHEAATVLLREVAHLKAPGVTPTFDESHHMLEMQTGGSYCRVWYGGPKKGFQVSQRSQEHTTQSLGARIEYDPVSGEFVATDVDMSVAPIPGAPFPRRDAIAVLVDAITEYVIGRVASIG